MGLKFYWRESRDEHFPGAFNVVMQSGEASRTHFQSAAAAYEALR